MTSDLQRWVQEAQATGTLTGLPDRHFIDGAAVASVDGATMATLDPGTGRVFAQFAAGQAADVDDGLGDLLNVLVLVGLVVRRRSQHVGVVGVVDGGESMGNDDRRPSFAASASP